MEEKMQDDDVKKEPVIAMVMLANKIPMNRDAFMKDFTTSAGYTVLDDSNAGSSIVALTVDGETVAVMYIPLPVAHGDIGSTAEYAYNWMTAEKELEKHEAHIIITVMGDGDIVKKFSILTAVTCSILRTQDAIGVYKGGQSLLIPRKHYLAEIKKRAMHQQLPLNLWIYFGLRTINDKAFGYTYGLHTFGKKELEIWNSTKNLTDIRGFLYNMAYYIIENDVTFEDGQSCGLSEEDIIPITVAKGHFNDGDVFSLGF